MSLPFAGLFARRSIGSAARARDGITRRRGRGRSARAAAMQSATQGEKLEDRRLLAFQYWGINHTFVGGTGALNAYEWNFEVFNKDAGDPAVMYVRQNDILGRIEFDSKTSFSGLQSIDELQGFYNLVSPPRLGIPPVSNNMSPPATTPEWPSVVEGPGWMRSAGAYVAAWNAPAVGAQTFNLAKLRVTCAKGTVDPTFVLQTNDPFRLALEVDFSEAAPGSVGRVYINAPLADTAYGAAPVQALASWVTSYEFKADEIYIQAPVTPRTSNYYAARSLIEIQNDVTGGLTALVSEGDFHIAAGASVSGTTSVRLGQGVPPGSSVSNGWGFGGNGGDIRIDGDILNAVDVLLQVNSLDSRRIVTGPSGRIAGSRSLGIYNMGADGGVVNVRTADFAVTNIFAGSPLSTTSTTRPAANIGITVDQTRGNLVLNSLPASRGAISLKASQSATSSVAVNANFDTQGAVTLDAGILDIAKPISTSQGDLTLLANSISIGSSVAAGTQGVGNLVVTSRTGGIKLESAAVVQAAGESIVLTSAGNIDGDGAGGASLATLKAARLEMTAGTAGLINLKSAVDVVRARAGRGVTISDDDALRVENVQATSGGVTLRAQGALVIDTVTLGTGDVVATTTAGGLVARDIQTTSGNVRLTASEGDVAVVGGVTVRDPAAVPANDLVLTATRGNVRLDPAAVVTVADQIVVSAPAGRVLTPGQLGSIVVDSSGAGYAAAPAVRVSAGDGATAAAAVGDGQVTSLRIVDGGSGYSTAPAIVFDNTGTGGSGATAIAQVSQGLITGVTITNRGSGYKTPPAVRVVGSGSGAAIEASVNGLTSIAVSYPSMAAAVSYGVPPTVQISSGAGAAAGAVTVDGLGRIQGINLSTPGSGFVAPPAVTITDTSGAGARGSASATLTTGLPSVTVNSPGSGYSGGTTVSFPAPGGGGATATGTVSLGLTAASVTVTGGIGYAVGDLLEAVAGSGARFEVSATLAGVVTGVTVTAPGGSYSVGDNLWINGSGGTGLVLQVTSVDAGGRITSGGVSVSDGGSGYTIGNVFNHVGGGGGRYRVTAVSGGGAVTGLAFVSAGKGYTNRATALIGGSGFNIVPTFNDQSYQVVGVTVSTPGSRYDVSASYPLTLANAGTGTGAALFGDPASVVDAITVINPGSGYDPSTTIVTLTPPSSGGGALSQAVSVDGQGSILGINLATRGGGYTGTPTVTITDASGSGAGARALANMAWGVTDLVLANGGSGYATAPAVTIAAPVGGGTAATAVAVIGTAGAARGVVQSIRITSPGSGYASGETPAVSFFGAATTPALATAGVSRVVASLTITSAGSGYNPQTTRVSIDPIGSGATAVANLTGGVLSAAVLAGGSGYDPATTSVTVAAPVGGGAAATAIVTVSGGVVTGITITNPGYGYGKEEKPVVTINGNGSGDGLADASATVGNVVGSIRLTSGGSGYSSSAPPVVRLLPQGAGSAATTTAVIGGVTGYVVEDGGSGYGSAPSVTITGGGAGAAAVASTTAGRVSFVRPTAFGTGYTVAPTVEVGGSTGFPAQVSALVSGVTEVAITNPGSGYAVSPSVIFAPPPAGGILPQATAVLTNVAQLSGKRLSWTALEGPVAAVVSQFNRVSINLTGAGDVVVARPTGDLTIEGVTTLDGSIALSAPKLTIAGPLTTGDASSLRNRTIRLEATAGDLAIDAAVGSLLAGSSIRTPLADSITLLAQAGAILSTSATPGLLTSNSVVFDARDGATLNTDTGTIAGAARGSTGNVVVTQTLVDANGNTLPLTVSAVTTNGGSVAITIKDLLTIDRVDATAAGTVTLTADKNILGVVAVPTAANVVASTATITSTGGKVDLDVLVSTLNASAVTSTIDIVSLGSGPIDLASVAAKDPVTIVAAGNVVATNVSSADGSVSIKAESGTSRVSVGQISAVKDVIVVRAAQDIVSAATGTTRNISATSARLNAGGKIDLRTAVSVLSASARDGVTVGESDAITLGDSRGLPSDQLVTSVAGDVVVTAGGTIDAFRVEAAADKAISLTSTAAGVRLQSVTAGTVTVAGKGDIDQSIGAGAVIDAATLTVTGNGSPISLDTADNRIGTFSATNGNGRVSLRDTAGNLTIAGITGGPVAITAAGPVDQTAAITAGALSITGGGGAIVLDTKANAVTSFSATNGAGSIAFKDTAGGLTVAGITGGAVTLTVAGAVDQTAAIAAASLTITGANAAIALESQANDVGSFAAANGTAAVAFKDTAGSLTLAGITGGPVTITAGGIVDQTAAVTATTLTVTGNGGGIALDSQPNSVATFAASNGAGAIAFRDAVGGLTLAGVIGGNVTIVAAGPVDQTVAINAAGLTVNGAGGAITLTHAGNAIAAFGSTNVGGTVALRDTVGGLTLARINAGAGNVSITAAGAVDQTAAVTAAGLVINGNGGAITLGGDNDVGSFAATNGVGSVLFRDTAGGLVVAGITGGSVALSATGGGLTQSAPIVAVTLSAAADGGISFNQVGNSLATLAAATTTSGDITVVNAGSFSTGAVTAGTAAGGDGNILLKAVTGNIGVGGQLTAKNDRVTLDARNGTFSLGGGITIDASMLIYYTATEPSPSPASAPVGTYPGIIAANGDLAISNAGSPVSIGGYAAEGNITIVGSTVTIDGLLQTMGAGKTVSIKATAGNITFVGTGAIDNAPALGGITQLDAAAGTVVSQPQTAVSGGNTSITVGQPLTFAGPIAANALTVTGNGGSIRLTGGNSIGSIRVVNASGSVEVRDVVGDLDVQGIAGGAVSITAAGSVSQTAAITAGALSVTGVGAAIALDKQANVVTSFAASNAGGSIAFKDTAGGLTLAGITGGAVTLTVAGAVDQTAAINAGSLAITGANAAIALDSQANVVGSFAATNGTAAVAFKDTAGSLTLAGVTGGPVTITAAGTVDQTAAVTATTLNVTGNGGGIALGSQSNSVTTFAASNGTGSIAFRDAVGGLTLAGVTGGSVTIQAAGAVSQTAAVKVSSLAVVGAGLPVTLTNAGNALAAFSATNGTGAVSLTETAAGDLVLDSVTSGPLTVVSTGNVVANSVAVSGAAAISATGGLAVSGIADGRLSSTGQLDLRNVQGQVSLVNGGTIAGNPVLVNSKFNMRVGGTITTAADLNAAFATVATLPTIVGSTYEIVVGASFAIANTITITRPITLRGTSSAVTLSGSGSVRNGIVVQNAGSGTRITSLAFANFAGTAIQLNRAANVVVSGVNVRSSGTGLAVAGPSTGTRVIGNTFTDCPVAIALNGATNATIGGTATGQPNRVTNSTRAGVFATGICTGTSVIKTAFTRTNQQYNVGASRGLRIVR